MDDGPDLYGAPAVRTRAAVLYSPKNLRNEEIPLEAFSGGLHVQVQLRSVGLSARDLHYYTHGSTANGEYRIQTPLVLGKEGAGQIMGIGAFVNKTWPHLQVGTRVVLEPGIPCRVCTECSNGRYNVCANLRTAGSAKSMPHISGFLRERVNWPGEMVHPYVRY